VSVTVRGVCPYRLSVTGHPEVSYSGVTGCKGRYFYADYAGSLDFRYSSQDAYMLWNQDVYHFVSGPRPSNGQLVFDQRFPDHHIVVRIDCPLPPRSPPLLPLSR
jgi:hypothetical protein